MNKKSLAVGNWKMELSHKGSLEVLGSLKKLVQSLTLDIDVVVCPSFTVLAEAHQLLANHKLQLGAQNVHWEEKGAWTGEVSVTQLLPLVRWCIVGHSERRRLAGETDEQVVRKAVLLERHGITPIICVGETFEEREAGETTGKVSQQMNALLSGFNRTSLSKVVVAYEPIWAIGTGITPQPSEAAETMLLIRKIAAERFDRDVADRLRIIYGGSVNANNAASFVSEPGIDGFLVGGASVRPLEFINIIKAFRF